MGREAKAKQAKRIKLQEADFFRLMAAVRLNEVLRLEAQQKAARIATEMVAREISESAEKGRALMATLAKKYGFEVQEFGFDEATCELIPR